MIENKEVNRMTTGAWKRPQSGCVPFVVHFSKLFCQVEVQSEGEDTDEGTGRYIDWYRGFAILHSLHSCKATAKSSLILGGFTVSRFHARSVFCPFHSFPLYSSCTHCINSLVLLCSFGTWPWQVASLGASANPFVFWFTDWKGLAGLLHHETFWSTDSDR